MATMTTTSKRHVVIPDETWRKTKIFAAASNLMPSQLIVAAIDEWIERHFEEQKLDALPTIPVAKSEVERRTEPLPKTNTSSPWTAPIVATYGARPFSPAPKPGAKKG